MFNVNKNTPLKIIRELIADDFNVIISNDDAKEIREASKRKTLLYSAEHLIIMSLDAGIERISNDRIKLRSGAVYSASEWAARK
jgi:hypothetical protein